MNNNQESIFLNKQKFLYYHKNNKEQHLIPNTSKAKETAILDGAKYFDTFSFCRSSEPSFPPAKKWGDLHIRFSAKKQITDENINCIKNTIRTFLYNNLDLKFNNFDSIKVIMLGNLGFGLSLPARLFKLENGNPLLPEIYQYITEKFEEFYLEKDREQNYIIHRGAFTNLDNVKLYKSYSIPLNLNNFISNNWSQLQTLSISPQKWIEKPSNSSEVPISYDLLRTLKIKAREIHHDKKMNLLKKQCDFIERTLKKTDIPKQEISVFTDVMRSFSIPITKRLLSEINKDRYKKITIEEQSSDIIDIPRISCEQIKAKKLCLSAKCNKNFPVEILMGWRPIIPLNRQNTGMIDVQTVKCAISILQKMLTRRIMEFQARDAHRLVRGSFRTITEVESGLRLLKEHNFLIQCKFPEYSYPGRRPSPWFLVNPMGTGKLSFQY